MLYDMYSKILTSIDKSDQQMRITEVEYSNTMSKAGLCNQTRHDLQGVKWTSLFEMTDTDIVRATKHDFNVFRRKGVVY